MPRPPPNILTGLQIAKRNLIRKAPSPALQTQPCGFDLTLRYVSKYNYCATLDVDNTLRTAASTSAMQFIHEKPLEKSSGPFFPLETFDEASDSSSSPSPSLDSGAGDVISQRGNMVHLRPGTYLVRFNEEITVPLDCMATIYPRSSLWRAGAGFESGVVDPGYRGVLGGLLTVGNKFGINLYRNARLAQAVFSNLGQKVTKGYDGIYQGATGVEGRDGSESPRKKQARIKRDKEKRKVFFRRVVRAADRRRQIRGWNQGGGWTGQGVKVDK